MKIYKFGGTSLGSPERMHNVVEIIVSDVSPKVVVLSAISGTTDTLYKVAARHQTGDTHICFNLLDDLETFYTDYIRNLYSSAGSKEKANAFLTDWKNDIRKLIKSSYSIAAEKEVVSKGEIIATYLFHLLLEEKEINGSLLSALEFMNLDESREPDIQHIHKGVMKEIQLDMLKGKNIHVTQGFICRNHKGKIDNLGRGGSDYTASLIGASIGAEEIQIWTDIDGIHNNDPRDVINTRPISLLTFDEAAELAYFGAKILHPSTILPAKQHDIPVKLKSTLNPDAEGTLITRVKSDTPCVVKAVAAKDGIIAIKIRSSRMLMAYGFLRKVFEIFEKYKTPIDMITTSEVAVSLTIDNPHHLYDIVAELEYFGETEVDKEQSIICIVGNRIMEEKGVVYRIFSALQDIPVRMISYGGSKNNISVLVRSEDKKQALNALHDRLFIRGTHYKMVAE